MYKRLIILSVIIVAALSGLTLLGYHAIEKWAQGLELARLGEFAEVAEQIRQDVKRKLDEFIQTEQERPYTDYQYYYVPENVAPGQQRPLLRSPLGARIENNLAYGHFQMQPDGAIVTPYYKREQSQKPEKDKLSYKADVHLKNIEQNLLPALSGASGTFRLPAVDSLVLYEGKKRPRDFSLAAADRKKDGEKQRAEGKRSRTRAYAIQSLEKAGQREQVITQERSIVASNVAQTQSVVAAAPQQSAPVRRGEQAEPEEIAHVDGLMRMAKEEPPDNRYRTREARRTGQAELFEEQVEQTDEAAVFYDRQPSPVEEGEADTVQIRIEPFVTIVVGGGDAQESIFDGQVFVLRHVQIEDRHFQQGFQLNEKKLIEEVKESAERFMRDGMSFELPQTKNKDSETEDAAYTAILDFGFGDLVLNLKEIDTARIGKQISQLRNWYFSIIVIVLLAVTLGLVSLWRNARAQIKLAEKKDDFISAVSHELRTPLTSIRMYSEMLEKDWVKSEDKLAEYYRNMRQESERLSRLIENVLDFSRIQKGRKKYTFSAGDINECIAGVVEMMTPYAAQNDFLIRTELERLGQTTFDGDAVKQIVVNLLDNAIKYARNSEDKTITVRTKSDGQFILIEVEDHGPGVPHRQRKKIFEEFYRLGSEATRETTGTGLGLALVKKFAQAHNGFVEILTAKPAGAIFRVGLAAQTL